MRGKSEGWITWQNVSIVGVPASRDAGRAISRDYLPPTIPTSALIFQASLPVVLDVCDALRDANTAAPEDSMVTSSATVPLSLYVRRGTEPVITARGRK